MQTYPELKPLHCYAALSIWRDRDYTRGENGYTKEQYQSHQAKYKHIFINDSIFSDYMYPFSYNFRLTGHGGCYLGDTYQLLEKEFPFYGFHTVEKLLVDDELQDLPAKSRL